MLVFLLMTTLQVEGAVVPPPWADPGNNPCASQPGGWQLLYWPEDGKCYKIFQKGYPCPETMELTPGINMTAECRCPPGTAQSARDALCHKLYVTGPCRQREYFAPVTERSSRQRWGTCREVEPCPKPDELFWPMDQRCYRSYTQGPCQEGQLISPGYPDSPLGECRCDNDGRMARYFWKGSGTCHEHYSPGPCQEKGMLFLPEGKCGCHAGLQQYHQQSGLCYQIGTVGPCPAGHHFVLPRHNKSNLTLNESIYAQCQCKDGHILWGADGNCYRPFTRGPCSQGEMLDVNYVEGNISVRCVPLPCPAGRLYFPGGKGCHRVGTQGPCPPSQVVLFQESVKTSIEGISYQGMCGCSVSSADPNSFYPTLRADDKASYESQCLSPKGRKEDSSVVTPTSETTTPEDLCGLKRGMITWTDNSCVHLYTQGPCNEGEWVVPDRGKGQRRGRGWKLGKCECRPGFTTAVDEETGKITCQPPTVLLAKFLNTKS